MPLSEDETDIGLLQAGTPQFDYFYCKLKRSLNQWIGQIDAAIVTANCSRNKIYQRYYNNLK